MKPVRNDQGVCKGDSGGECIMKYQQHGTIINGLHFNKIRYFFISKGPLIREPNIVLGVLAHFGGPYSKCEENPDVWGAMYTDPRERFISDGLIREKVDDVEVIGEKEIN